MKRTRTGGMDRTFYRHQFQLNTNFSSWDSFYIGDKLEISDRRIMEIRMPRLIRRNFRPLKEREYYHAYEWKFILLFVAYPILKGVLQERYLFPYNNQVCYHFHLKIQT